MTLASEYNADVEIPQFLSTHPNNDSRAQSLDTWIPMVSTPVCICLRRGNQLVFSLIITADFARYGY